MPALLIHEVELAGEVTDLLVDVQRITAPSSPVCADVDVIEARGLTALLSPIDVHVHFRDPGLTEKEDLLSGARAAAAGGFPTVLCEPNTRPVIDTPEQVSIFAERVAHLGIPLAVYTKAAVSRGQQGEGLTDIPALRQARAAALSDDGEPLLNEELLIAALRASVVAGEAPLVLTAHCEETPRSAEKVRVTLGAGLAMAREVEIIRLHLQALEAAACGRLHIQHVSLAESVTLIAQAKRLGLAVTAEATPHHLLLCAEDILLRVGEPDANWKMNPPLRSRADMLALRRALAEGIINMVATDHAPHTPAEKAQSWDAAPSGVIGLETAMGAYLSLVRDETISLPRLNEALNLAPARLLPSWATPDLAGSLTLVDLNAAWTVDPGKFYSKARNCPFAGHSFSGKVVCTIAKGQVVYRDGEVNF